MKVCNMINNKGDKVINQFIITGENFTIFQSYDSIIVKRYNDGKTILDKYLWNYSQTTGKYRNIFLGETKKETEKKIEKGIYILDSLN